MAEKPEKEDNIQEVAIAARRQLKERHEHMAFKLRSECRYWEAQYHLKKAIDIIKELADESKDFAGKYNGYKDITIHRQTTQKLDCNFDFNNFKTEGGEIVEVIKVPENTFDYDYLKIYEKYCSADVKEVIVYERYVWIREQIDNMKHLLMSLKTKCPNLKFVMLKCTKNLLPAKQINDLKLDMSMIGINFVHELLVYAKADDHKVVFNNGYVFCFRNGFDLNTYFDPFSNEKNKIKIWKVAAEVF